MVRDKKNPPKTIPEQKDSKKNVSNNKRHIIVPKELKKKSPAASLSLETILTKSDVERLIRSLSSPDKKKEE
ncbi:MAG: hypothetical protein HQL71_01415 [Magnetococcales bacterium]|nr:hypothetical protein [Magnetococcales bacterium]